MAPVAVLKRFTSCAESTDRPLLMEDETELTPSPLVFGSMSASGLKKHTHTWPSWLFSRERHKEQSGKTRGADALPAGPWSSAAPTWWRLRTGPRPAASARWWRWAWSPASAWRWPCAAPGGAAPGSTPVGAGQVTPGTLRAATHTRPRNPPRPQHTQPNLLPKNSEP